MAPAGPNRARLRAPPVRLLWVWGGVVLARTPPHTHRTARTDAGRPRGARCRHERPTLSVGRVFSSAGIALVRFPGYAAHMKNARPKNPRVHVTVTPSMAVKIDRVSQLTGQSKSGFVAELLIQSEPVLDRMIRVLEAAHAAREAYTEETIKGLEAAQERIEEQLGVVLEAFDEGTADLVQDAETISRRRRKGSVKPSEKGAEDEPGSLV